MKVYVVVAIDADDEAYYERVEAAFTSEVAAERAVARLHDKVTNAGTGEVRFKHEGMAVTIRELEFYQDARDMPIEDENDWYGPDDDFEEKRAALFAKREFDREQARLLRKALTEPPRGPVVPLPEEYRKTVPNFEEELAAYWKSPGP